MMVSLDNAVVARLTRSGETFEIMVDSEKAFEFKKGKDYSMENILAANEIFKDAKKGERASSSELEKEFGTTEVFEVAKRIIRDGEVQLTTEQRRKHVEEKKLQIASIISKQGVNPKTKLPHPQQRILNAMEEAHVSVDPFKPADEQVKRVLEAIREIIPISFETIEIAIRVSMEHAGKVSSVMHSIMPVKKEEWKSDSWMAVVEIPAGMQNEIYEKINNMTAGTAEVKVISRKAQ
ncbi:MAG: ribosome assembly factor SBDS [Candidatus Aenigmatarchaeota archaeon]|nr:MAG: ribosome assembly factor SBDS [Candidatus Aenigmarchaeota archaeon]